MSTPFSPTVLDPLHLRYSHKFGNDVVIKFLEKYARGTNFVMKIGEIPKKTFYDYLIRSVRAKNQIHWESIKWVIKHVDTENIDDFKDTSLKMRRMYLTFVKYMGENEALNGNITKC